MSLPTLFLVDGEGMIRYRQRGYAPGMEVSLTEQVEALLAEL
jgi:hypothetical protein